MSLVIGHWSLVIGHKALRAYQKGHASLRGKASRHEPEAWTSNSKPLFDDVYLAFSLHPLAFSL